MGHPNYRSAHARAGTAAAISYHSTQPHTAARRCVDKLRTVVDVAAALMDQGLQLGSGLATAAAYRRCLRNKPHQLLFRVHVGRLGRQFARVPMRDWRKSTSSGYNTNGNSTLGSETEGSVYGSSKECLGGGLAVALVTRTLFTRHANRHMGIWLVSSCNQSAFGSCKL